MAQDLWNQNQDETYANEPGNMDQRRGFFGNGGAATPFEQMAAGFNADMAAESLSTYIAKTFLWMFVGLLVTFIVAYGMAASGIAYSMLAGAGRAARRSHPARSPGCWNAGGTGNSPSGRG